MKGICVIFYIKYNYFRSVIPKMLKKSFEKLDERAIKYKNCISINVSKTTLLLPWIIYEWMGNSTRQKLEIRLWKILIG